MSMNADTTLERFLDYSERLTANARADDDVLGLVLVGSTAGGQSHETIYTQIVSELLGLEAESIRVQEGDTDKLSWGTGTGATTGGRR